MCAVCRGGSDEGSPDGAYYFLLLVSFYWTLQVQPRMTNIFMFILDSTSVCGWICRAPILLTPLLWSLLIIHRVSFFSWSLVVGDWWGGELHGGRRRRHMVRLSKLQISKSLYMWIRIVFSENWKSRVLFRNSALGIPDRMLERYFHTLTYLLERNERLVFHAGSPLLPLSNRMCAHVCCACVFLLRMC